MRYMQLLEYDRSITLQKYGTKLLSASNADTLFLMNNKNLSDEEKLNKIITELESMDPTKNKQFVVWITNQFIKGQFRIEDGRRVRNVLAAFITTDLKRDFKRRQLSLDINRFDFHTLAREIRNFETAGFEDVEVQPKTHYTHANEMTVLYNGPLGQLIIPKSTAASQEVGAGTEWCTAYPDEGCQFDNYNEKGPLFVWIEPNGEKYQFHFEDGQFRDKDDMKIDSTTLYNFRNKHPILSKLFKSREKTMLVKKDGKSIIKYLDTAIKDRWPEAEPILFSLVDEHGKKTFGREYIYMVRKPLPEREKEIAKDPELASAYISYVLKKPWPEAEPALASVPRIAASYAAYQLKKPWPEAEPVIFKDPQATIEYLSMLKHTGQLRQLNTKLPDIEKMLLLANRLSWAFEYAESIAERRWPELEQLLKKRLAQGERPFTLTGASDAVRRYQEKYGVDLGIPSRDRR